MLEAVGRDGGLARALEGVEGQVDGSWPDCVHRDLESVGRGPRHEVIQTIRLDAQQATVLRLVLVGLVDGRVPEDAEAVDADLDAEHLEPVVTAAVAHAQVEQPIE